MYWDEKRCSTFGNRSLFKNVVEEQVGINSATISSSVNLIQYEATGCNVVVPHKDHMQIC